ncbi:helix-turn-helix domain-containing protein [Serratia bockelmannii]|uniref:helix-turn-helix domain-containing protein n=1 Tax=Serratia bockelmannii TaxID=2703793 RepID=UPI002361BE20|nr:helix-turn-helix transcriptional regulator [Serratia bockelmannii]
MKIIVTNGDRYFTIGIAELVKKSSPSKNIHIITNEIIINEKYRKDVRDGDVFINPSRSPKFHGGGNIFYDDEIDVAKHKLTQLISTNNNHGVYVDMWKTDGLTQAELNILKLIAKGIDYKKIILTLGIKKKTFLSHRQSIIKKLGFRNRLDLMVSLIINSY